MGIYKKCKQRTLVSSTCRSSQ